MLLREKCLSVYYLSDFVSKPNQCGIHLTTTSTKSCKICGLPMCETDICAGKNVCKVCENERLVYSLTKFASQLMFFIFIFGGILILTKALSKSYFTIILFLGVTPILIVQKIKFSGLFKGLTPLQSVYPALYKLSMSDDINYYHEALSKAIKAKKEGKELNYSIIRYGLLNGVLLSKLAIPSTWSEEWAELLGYDSGDTLEKEIIFEFFDDILGKIKPGKSIGALAIVSKVVADSKDEEKAEKLLVSIKKNLEEVVSEELDYFGDEYLRDIFLAEDYLMEIKSWNEKLEKLVNEIFELHNQKFEPPIVPKNRQEELRLMTAEAERQQRLMRISMQKSQRKIEEYSRFNRRTKELGEVSLEED